MSENKPVNLSRTIWISLLTSVFYMTVTIIKIPTAISNNSSSNNSFRQYLAQTNQEATTPETTSTPSDSETSNTEKPTPETELVNPLEKKIIAELNRVRTNPKGYADWLEDQKQYYQGMLLKLPGEQPIRTNRGLRSLEEAITFLRQQKPLPALSNSTKLSTTAKQQITAINNNQIISSENNLVYNKVTPEAIVMQLVVDDGFPDRPHRLAIFNQNYQNAGIACREIPVYNNVCAIAYTTETPKVAQHPTTTTPSSNSQPETTPKLETEDSNQLSVPPTPNVNTSVIPKTEELIVNSESSSNAEEELETTESDNNSTTTPESEPTTTTATESDNNSEVATDSSTDITSEAVELVEAGILQEGDETIPNDGSFYDSFPLEGSAGDSFTITLESTDFDTFLAIMDGEGNIIEQNDDINEQDSNSRIEITLPDNGTYSVIVNAYDKGGKGNYVLKVSR